MKRCVSYLFTFSLLILCFSCCTKKETTQKFSLHLFQEPLHLDPSQSSSSSASYFFFNTLRGLYIYDGQGNLKPEGGSCLWLTPLKLKCILFERKWSDGSRVTSQDYLRAFQHLLRPETSSPRSSLLFSILNAQKIYQKKADLSELGFDLLNEKEFHLIFQEEDSDFIYKLSSTALFPLPKNQMFEKKDYKSFLSNGPYQIDQWISGQEITAKPNPFYTTGHPQRPLLRFYFIENDMTAYRLYQSGKLQFLRRLPSHLIDELQKTTEFYQTPMARFDYLGFGPRLHISKEARQAFSQSIDYEKLKFILKALGRPGCPSLPARWMDQAICYNQDLKLAKEKWSQVPDSLKNLTLQMKFSQMGGEDIKKQIEFFQQQWTDHLGTQIEVNSMDQKSYVSILEKSPPDLFRKGIGLDIPTCLNALETFSSKSEDNFIALKDVQYENILKEMRSERENSKYKILCRKGVQHLMKDFWIIPLGEMHFSHLASDQFTGWTMNSMNQLDLSQLRTKNLTSTLPIKSPKPSKK